MAESGLSKLPIPARVGVGALFLVLLGAAYYVALYSETSDNIEQTKAGRVKLKRDLAAAKLAEIQYGKDLEELGRRRERTRDLNKSLPIETEYPAFLSSVQAVAVASDVELTSWSPQGEVRQEYYSKVPMQVTFAGRYHQIAKFFYGIGQNGRIMNFENISLSPEKTFAKTGEILVKGTVTAFKARSVAPKKKSRKRGR
jgi:type IV pilus assembly protein PilO